MSNKFALAQLRHAYPQLLNGQVKNQAEFARGLLGPAIEAAERAFLELDRLAAENRAMREQFLDCADALEIVLSSEPDMPSAKEDYEIGEKALERARRALSATTPEKP